MTVSEMAQSDRPIAEQFRVTAKKWLAADNEARLLEEMKTPELERRKHDLIAAQPDSKLTDAAAERTIKASDDWRDYIRKMVEAKTLANRYAMQLEHIKMQHRQEVSANADKRAEMKMTGH